MEACLNGYFADRTLKGLPVEITVKKVINLLMVGKTVVKRFFDGRISGGISGNAAVGNTAAVNTAAGKAAAATNPAKMSNAGHPMNSVNSTAERLLDAYGNKILRMAYSYLHNMDDAEDILQDTLIRYLQAAPEFESAEHEKAWLLRVTANLSKNRIDYNKIREYDELDETLIGEEREDLAFVWDAVKELPENYREVIHLFYQEGYRTSEIAKILNRKESSVRSDLKRGREKLKTILKEAYDFE